MANGGIVTAPKDYSQAFCNATRASFHEDQQETKDAIESINRRFWALLMLGLAQVTSAVGVLVWFILTRVEWQHAISQLPK